MLAQRLDLTLVVGSTLSALMLDQDHSQAWQPEVEAIHPANAWTSVFLTHYLLVSVTETLVLTCLAALVRLWDRLQLPYHCVLMLKVH